LGNLMLKQRGPEGCRQIAGGAQIRHSHAELLCLTLLFFIVGGLVAGRAVAD
jgi:hypothetical protein